MYSDLAHHSTELYIMRVLLNELDIRVATL